MRLPGLAELLIAVATLAAFVCTGHFAAESLIAEQSARQLAELGDAAMRRAEVAARYGVETLDEITRGSSVSCDETALQAARLHVYQHGTVKDIRVLERDGSIRCSAYPDTLEFDKEWTNRAEMLPVKGSGLHLFRVEQFSGMALGLVKDISDTTSLAAIVGVDGSLVDIMPDELRARSTVALELSDGREIVRSQVRAPDASVEAPVVAGRASPDFPLRTRISVEARALDDWHREPYLPIVLVAGLLGMAFGTLLARSFIRPPDALAEMDAAIGAREFKPYLQPLFDLRSGRIVGCEALARWVRADGTVTPPARFIPLAESSGRIEAITWQILEGALTALRPILQEDRRFKVSVNIVPDHILQDGFADKVRRVVAEAGASPGQVVLEITERQQVDDAKRAAAVIAGMHALGFQFALDDVGVGHSGLSSLQALGASIIKIDKFFVDAICRDATATAIVQMLVRLARELQMSVVAEGIEHAAQSEALAACGVQQGQGYLVSPPLPAAQFLAFVAASRDAAASPVLSVAA